MNVGNVAAAPISGCGAQALVPSSKTSSLGWRILRVLGNFLYYGLILPCLFHSIYKCCKPKSQFIHRPTLEFLPDTFEKREYKALANDIQTHGGESAAIKFAPSVLRLPDKGIKEFDDHSESLGDMLIKEGVSPIEASRFLIHLAGQCDAISPLPEFQNLISIYRIKTSLLDLLGQVQGRLGLSQNETMDLLSLLPFRNQLSSPDLSIFLQSKLGHLCPFWNDPGKAQEIRRAFIELQEAVEVLHREGKHCLIEFAGMKRLSLSDQDEAQLALEPNIEKQKELRQVALAREALEYMMGICSTDCQTAFCVGKKRAEVRRIEQRLMTVPVFIQSWLAFAEAGGELKREDPNLTDEELVMVHGSIEPHIANCPSKKEIQAHIVLARQFKFELEALSKEFPLLEIWKQIKIFSLQKNHPSIEKFRAEISRRQIIISLGDRFAKPLSELRENGGQYSPEEVSEAIYQLRGQDMPTWQEIAEKISEVQRNRLSTSSSASTDTGLSSTRRSL